MKIYYNNWFDDYEVFASSEAASSAVENIQDIHLSAKWRSTDENDQYVATNTGDPINPTAAFIFSTNITDSATVKIQGHTTADFSAPDVDITMTRVDEDLYYTIAGFSSKQYWRFFIDDPTNTDEYVEMGRVWLGDTTTITKGASRNFTESISDTSNISVSRSGQVYGDIGYRYRSYSLTFPYWSDTMKTTVDTFVESVIGGKPFVAILDENNIDKIPFMYSILEPGIDYNHMIGFTKWNSNLTFREAK